MPFHVRHPRTLEVPLMKRTVVALSAVCALTLAMATGSAAEPNGDGAAPAVPAGVEGPPAPDTARDGGDPAAAFVGQQKYSTVYEGVPGEIAGNPFADAVDGVDRDGRPTRQVLLSWQANEDVAAAASERTLIQSFDRGYSFPTGHAEGISGFYRKLRDGDILGVEFIPHRVLDPHRLQLLQKRSKDGGRTWRTEHPLFTTDKTFDSTAFDRGIRVHRDIIEDPQGNLLLTYYTKSQGEPAGSAEMAISRDRGRTWQRHATIFPPIGNRSFNEVGISWAVNGDLVSVARSHVGSTLSQMYTARSSDRGRTWTAPVPVQITTASGEPAPQTGVMPVLHLLPNGIMALTFGRPDNWVAISPDGLGRAFERAQVTYRNFPEQDTGAFQRTHGSSGNGAHAVVGPNRILQVGDNCAPSWGCPATDAGFQVDGEYRVWKKFIDIDAPGVGRIDLLSKFHSGAVSIDTDMVGTDRDLPETRPVGAIDGSTDWAASAVRAGGDGTGRFTLTLDRTYTLTKAGLSLHPGLPSNAVVEVSTDRTQWTKVVDTGPLTSYALTYFPVDRVAARYVRVTVRDPNRGPALLNELELHSTTNSFENDAVGYVPRGYRDAVGATVTTRDTGGDGHALRLADAWNDRIAQATWVSGPAPAQNLRFRFQSVGYARSLSFTTNGVDASGATVAAFQIAVQSDGRIARYDAATRAWTKITGVERAIPQKTWAGLEVRATLTGAEVLLDGTPVATVPPTNPGVTALTGHTFSTSGTAPTYDNFVLDDVEQS
jgi:hypothetical protein